MGIINIDSEHLKELEKVRVNLELENKDLKQRIRDKEFINDSLEMAADGLKNCANCSHGDIDPEKFIIKCDIGPVTVMPDFKCGTWNMQNPFKEKKSDQEATQDPD